MANDGEDLVVVREILAREIETINTYQRMLGIARSEEVVSFLAHIIDEEKEHVAEALQLIKQYDPVQAGLLESPNQHWRAHAAHAETQNGPAQSQNPQRQEHPSSLTVGSLRSRAGK